MSYLLNKCAVPFNIKSLDDCGIFSGYASVFNELDDQGDRVLKGAFQKSIQKRAAHQQRPKMLWQHNLSEPIGTWLEIKEDDHGLRVQGQLILELQRAREAYALIKAGVLDSLSIGYRVIQSVKGALTNERHLTQLDLFEISLVTFPANRAAKIVQVKNHQYQTQDEPLMRALHRAIRVLRS